MTNEVKADGDGPIVMVDDSESDIYLAKRCYQRSSLNNQFLGLSSATQLLAYLNEVRAGRKPMPALVLLDINMPDLDGFEALAKIRRLPEFVTIPVITMLTHSDDPADAKKSVALGANGLFTKPDDIERYVAFFDSLRA